ncbi:MAG TPA: hypothetical protein DCY72_05835 [Ruminococcaceae bacterium]|nr:hypothetical protein [Oscillospiraceae bacterium]
MNSQKQNRHSLMAKGIMVLLALLVLVFIITFAWFTPPEEINEAHGISMKTKSGSDFEYAIGFKTSQTFGEYLVTDFTNSDKSQWDVENLTVPGKTNEGTPIKYNLLYDYQPIDLTGNGYTLIRPAMDYGNWKIKSGTNDYSIAEANTQYISFDLILRSKSATTLSLGPNSYAIGASEVDGTTAKPDGSMLTGTGVDRISDYGSFSRDAIVGAVRVAFLGFDDTLTAESYIAGTQDDKLNHTPSLLWVPRPDLYLNNNGNDLSTSGWSLNTGVTSGQTFNLNSQAMKDTAYSTYQHQYYNVFNAGYNDTVKVVKDESDYVHVSSKDTEGNEYHLNDTVELIHLDKPMTVHENNEDVTYYYGKVRVRIWVEGTDTESRRALSKGKFKFNFDLTTN